MEILLKIIGVTLILYRAHSIKGHEKGLLNPETGSFIKYLRFQTSFIVIKEEKSVAEENSEFKILCLLGHLLCLSYSSRYKGGTSSSPTITSHKSLSHVFQKV